MAPAVRAPSTAQSTVIVGGSESKCPDLPGPGRRTLCVPSDKPVKDQPVLANLIANPNNIPSAFNLKEQRSQELMDICFKTLELSAKNRQLQKDLTELREQTRKFVESVKGNPRAPEGAVTTRASLAPLPKGLSTVPLERPTVQPPTTFLSPMLLNLAYMSPTLYNPFLLKSLGVSNGEISSGINQAKTLGHPAPNGPSAVTENKPKENCCSTINFYSNNNNNNKAQSPLCSCCTEDQAEGNVAFYAQLNGMARSWTNSLMIRGRKRMEDTTTTTKSSLEKSSPGGQKRPSEFKLFKGASKRFKSSTTHSLLGSMSPSNEDTSSSSSSNSCTSSPMSPFGRSSSPLFGCSKDPFIRGMDSGDDGDDDFSRQNLFASSEDDEQQEES